MGFQVWEEQSWQTTGSQNCNKLHTKNVAGWHRTRAKKFTRVCPVFAELHALSVAASVFSMVEMMQESRNCFWHRSMQVS